MNMKPLNSCRKVACSIALMLVTGLYSQAQSSANTLDVVSWNIEYFGAPYNSGPINKDVQ